MRLLKKINNNFALALDSKGSKIIVEGKGIGFQKMPCDIQDLSIVKRTYYDINDQHVSLIQSVSSEVLEICNKVYAYAETMIVDKLNPNLTFILADHIQFAIERYERNIQITMPIYYDVEYLYPKETKIAEYAVNLILEKMNILLIDGEKTGIALTIINNEIITENKGGNYNEYIELCTSIIERSMGLKINRDSFNYSRFVTHLEYLFRRSEDKKLISTENLALYQKVSESYPKVQKCVDIMENVLLRKKFQLNEEEKLYLMLHVNRLCSREDCYL